MAKIHNNIFVRGLTGSVGDQFVIRKTRTGRTIVANKPTFNNNREFTDAQKAQHDAFRKATTYAKLAKNEPVYIERAKNSDVTPYNLAVADWFRSPEVLDIDVSNWTGQVGQEIRVRADDDTLVTRVHVMIRASNSTSEVLEEGDAVRSMTDGLLWVYTTKTAVTMNPGTRLDAMAYDMPGNSGASSLELS